MLHGAAGGDDGGGGDGGGGDGGGDDGGGDARVGDTGEILPKRGWSTASAVIADCSIMGQSRNLT